MPAINNLTGTGYLLPLQSGNSGKYLTTDGSTLSWGTPSGGGGLSGSGTTNYISKWTSSSALGNSLVYDSGTNVGIGTATPSHLLEVNGDAMVSGTTELMSYTGVGINADSSTMLYVQGSGNTAEDFSAVFQNSDFDNLMKIHNNGKINMGFLPTSATGLSTGDLWNDSGTLKIV